MKEKYAIRLRTACIMITVFIGLTISGCKKFVNIAPPDTTLSQANVYSTDVTAAAVLTGIYASISSADNPLSVDGGLTGLTFGLGLSADELTLYDQTNSQLVAYYSNNLDPVNNVSNYWSNFYGIIYQINLAIQGLNSSSGLTPAVKSQLLGEAYFTRSLYYFYLVNLYGNVPLALTPDYKTNAVLPRTPVSQVYQQLIADLITAKGLLSANFLESDALTAYSPSTAQRVRPTKWAAEALLARIYLFSKDFPDAYALADSVIGNSSLFGLDSLPNVFLANSSETIFSFQPVNTSPSANTGAGDLFVLPSTGPNTSGNYPVYLSSYVINSFEPGDLRRVNWVDSVITGGTTYYFPYKYKMGAGSSSTTENIMVLRLGELYLVRAEAQAMGAGNSGTGALADVNAIRQRAGLQTLSNNLNQSQIVDTIQHERQVELFTEWGDRWLNLIRTGNINNIMGTPGLNICAAKGGTWNSDLALFPIPESEIILNPQLVQNPGYQ